MYQEATIWVRGTDIKDIEQVPHTYPRSIDCNMTPGSYVMFEASLSCDPKHLNAAVAHCQNNGIMITRTEISGPPPLMAWMHEYPDPVSIDVTKKIKDNEKSLLNSQLYEKNIISSETLMKELGVEPKVEYILPKEAPMTHNPPKASVGEEYYKKYLQLQADNYAFNASQTTVSLHPVPEKPKPVPKPKTVSQKIEDGRSFEMDFEELS